VNSALAQDANQYLALLQRRRGLIVTCVGACLLVATLYNYTTRPLYQASAQILIDRALPKVLPVRELIDTNMQDYQTEYQLLRSRMLLEQVVEKLDLQKSPELMTGPTVSPWERLRRRFLGQPPTAPVVGSDGMPLSPAVATLQSRISIEPLPGGRLVNLHFNAYDPSLAALVANTLAETYIQQSVNLRFTTSSDATEFLSDRLREQKVKLADAERALLEFRKLHGLVNFNEDSGAYTEKVITLERATMMARMQRIGKEALLSQLRGLPPGQIASNPAAIQASPVLQEARGHLSDLKADERRLSESLGDRHPDMLRVRADIRAAEDKLNNEGQGYLRTLQTEIQAAREQEDSLLASLETTKKETLESSAAAAEYTVLKREVDSNRQMFESLMSRSKETSLETELKSSNVRIVERAEVPGGPILPRRDRNYELALVLGLSLGIGLSLLFEHLDNTLKTPEDVKNTLRLPFLGMVPEVLAKPGPGQTARPLIMKNAEVSAVSDSYRILRTNLLFSRPDSLGGVFLVTSANPGEGKTTTVANLAASLAQNGGKVLAIDADLRRPTMHQIFGVSKVPGLTDLIVGGCQASAAIKSTRFKDLQTLPCGYIPPNPTELLGSASFREVIRALRTHYEWVLIDTPPILAMADTPVLAPFVDGAILVVGAEQSSRTAVQRAVEQIVSVGGKITGVVLNKVNLERNSYYYGQYYGEYYRSYYAEKEPAKKAAAPTTSSRSARRS
jgi:capsular exopolysaccharide synthesis family protein